MDISVAIIRHVVMCEPPRMGGIAQLAEHELCKLGVTGSNPVASTTCAARRKFEVRSSKFEVRISDGRVAQLVRACP